MKTVATLIAAAFVATSATIALAQGVGGGGGVRGALVLAPEQRTIVKEYVTSHKVAPVKLKERISVGATLPASVKLAPVPAEWVPHTAITAMCTRTTVCISWSRARVVS